MNKITRLAAAFVLSGLLLAAPAAQAAPALLGASANFELEVNEMELEITADDPRPKAYLYTGGAGGRVHQTGGGKEKERNERWFF